MSSLERCGECRFSWKKGRRLSCRRFPPVIVDSDSDGESWSAFPEVNPVNYCGEFKSKDARGSKATLDEWEKGT